MSNLILIPVLLFLSFFSYLFFLWKYLREDYDTNRVFSFGFSTYAAFLVGLGIGVLVSNIWFWTSLLVYGIIFIFMTRKFRFRVVEVIEASTPGFIVTYLGILAYGLFHGGGVQTLIFFASSALLLVAFFFLKKNYKRFGWYRSGRLGFSSMITLGTLFLIRAVSSLVNVEVISFVGVVGFIPSAILSFFCFFTVYNLNQRK